MENNNEKGLQASGNIQTDPAEMSGTAEKKSRRQLKKERKARWKAQKKAERAALKEKYRDAPWLKRVFRLYLLKPIVWLVVLGLLLSGISSGVESFLSSDLFATLVNGFIDIRKTQPVDDEVIYAASPIDEEGAAAIDALGACGADETWTICVYMVGADLEDSGENDLSPVTSARIADICAENEANAYNKQVSALVDFTEELEQNGLDLPEYLYKPQKPIASSKVVTEDVTVATREGCASADISEICSGVWSDKITVVIQTGGARRWSNSLVNPNKTQRFEYKNGEFKEIANMPLQDSCDPDTVADFLQFAEENYKSDHRMLILWDHGGGAFGYGHDSIFGSGMSLKDLRNAFAQVYQADTENPPFDILGFDACLMGSAEVASMFDGFAKYMAASEEIEPGDGWDYGVWLQAMSDDPTMHPAKICQAIADSYMNYYMTYYENVGFLTGKPSCTFCVLDVSKAAEVYRAYCDVAKAQLTDAVSDLGVLSEMGSTGNRAARMVSNYYKVYNTVDLGMYMDYLSDSYPEECAAVREKLEEAVLYHRENGSLADTRGLSIYLPVNIEGYGGLCYFLNYVNDICDDDNIRALYYYKLAGCLNEEHREYVSTLTDEEPLVLDTSIFRTFSGSEAVLMDGNYKVAVSEELARSMQSNVLELCLYDSDKNTLTYYGQDDYVTADGEGNLTTEFDGEWITLDGQPLAVELVSSTGSAAEYRAKVMHDGKPSYLLFSWERDSEEFTINAINEIPEDGSHMETRTAMTTIVGEKIKPIYEEQNLETNETTEVTGKTILLKTGSKIEMKQLTSGTYLSSIVIEDPRGDLYYSSVVELNISGGKVTARDASSDFVGSAY